MEKETTLKEKALDWWNEISLEESWEIERKEGVFGHDMGNTAADIVEFYKIYKLGL